MTTSEVFYYANSFRRHGINELSGEDEDQAWQLPPIGGESIQRYTPNSDVREAVKTGKGLDALSSQERETAAKFYEEAAQRTTGINKESGRLFNLERARYLREGGPTPPGTLNEFKARLGIP